MTTSQPIDHVPEGYRKNRAGHLVPVERIKDIELEEDSLVMKTAHEAIEMNMRLSEFKTKTFEDITAFIQLSAEKYDVTVGGKKGNVTMYSFDGQYKVQRCFQDRLDHDEKLQIAKELMYECAAEWTAGANGNIKAILDWVFETNKDGQISTGRVLSLRRQNIVDEKWDRAMALVADSLRVIDSTSYIRVFRRVGLSDKYVAIPMDLASVATL